MPTTHARLARIAWIAAVACFCCAALAEDWPQWQGSRGGMTMETTGWPDRWAPEKLWQTEVGAGATSPIVADGKVYVFGYDGKRGSTNGQDVVRCIDAASGKQLWKARYRSRYYARTARGDQGRYGGPNASPACDVKAGRLITLSIDGLLCCWSVADGKLHWKRDLHVDFNVPRRPNAGGGVRDFGFCSSPKIFKGQVLVDVGAKEALLVAFDLDSGKELWRSEATGPAGSNSGPALLTVNGRTCAVSLALTEAVVTAIDGAKPGQLVARVPWKTQFACNIATPAVAANQRFLLTSAYNQKRSAMFQVDASGKIAQRWKVRDHSMIGSPVWHGERVYLPGPVCLDAKDGSRVWRGRARGDALILTGDDKLLVAGKGTVSLVETEGKQAGQTLATIDGVPTGWSHPALAGGVLVCKDHKGKMAAWRLAKPVPPSGDPRAPTRHDE